ncbi:MAG: TonB-dependent receptor [Cytophagales bacterium]|nr:TonB-dependent receptor [Cytophagales bacterium]
MRFLLLFFLIFIAGSKTVVCQQSRLLLSGNIYDAKNRPVPDVSIVVDGTNSGTISDSRGAFNIEIKEGDKGRNLIFRHLQYKDKIVPVSTIEDFDSFKVILEDTLRVLDQVRVTGIEESGQNASTFHLDPINAQFMPAPFQDISNMLITLPGVSSNNELSTGYTVRGGNFDENLVYVNNIPVYRPQIITAGQQEGLSFINIDLTGGIEFSSGGWESKYGDGLASALNINYKNPEKTGGSVNIGLLGGSAHIEGITNNRRISYLVGTRHKSSTYLLNTLETKGEYRPKFTDIQGYVNFDISNKGAPGNTEIGALFSYAQNRYLVRPTSRETTFGTFDNQLRLFMAFEGQERLTYDTWQSGLRLSHRFSSRWKSHLILSGVYSREREYYDIESGYLLCTVDNNPGSAGFNECMTNIGIGTNYFSGRNLLNAKLLNIESRNELILDDANILEFGVGYGFHDFEDRLNEYGFIDSADYVTISNAVKSESDLSYSRVHAYLQNHTELNSRHTLTYGLRALFQTSGDEVLISPRIQYAWNPVRLRHTVFRASAGMYQQAPFYREFRNADGAINHNLKAQKSLHGIVGMDVNFSRWGRPFKFIAEVYYKYLWDVNPYDIENVRIRYFADNMAKAYAAGIDFRLSGEFIPGDESWFSLGVLSTGEDLETDRRGYIPRPSDQRLNAAIFFQDHLPNLPTFRVYLRLLYSTGLPFSPPQNPEFRNSFRGSEYQRIDIGFSKLIRFGIGKEKTLFESLWISAEVLNLTGNQNTISYYWVTDVSGNYYAVPNSLSQRFLNIRANLKF